MRLAAELDLMGKGRGHGVANARTAIFLLRWRRAARGLVHPGCVVSETSGRGKGARQFADHSHTFRSEMAGARRVRYQPSDNSPGADLSAELQTPEAIGGAPPRRRVGESFAMLKEPAGEPQAAKAKVQEPKPVRQSKLARRRAPAPRYAMVRHPQFGWSGGSFWW